MIPILNTTPIKENKKITKKDKSIITDFVKQTGKNKFTLLGVIPINFKKWYNIIKIITIIESLPQCYTVNISKYSTIIYRVEGVTYYPVSSQYSRYHDDKLYLTLKSIVGFCLKYDIFKETDKCIIAKAKWLEEYLKKTQDAIHT